MIYRILKNPACIGALFFAIYAFFFMMVGKLTLEPLKGTNFYFFSTYNFAILSGLIIGSLFGKILAKKSHWIRPLLLGMLLAILVLALAALGMCWPNGKRDVDFYDISPLFLFIPFFYINMMYIGPLLIPLTGVVAVFFNKFFFPWFLEIIKRFDH